MPFECPGYTPEVQKIIDAYNVEIRQISAKYYGARADALCSNARARLVRAFLKWGPDQTPHYPVLQQFCTTVLPRAETPETRFAHVLREHGADAGDVRGSVLRRNGTAFAALLNALEKLTGRVYSTERESDLRDAVHTLAALLHFQVDCIRSVRYGERYEVEFVPERTPEQARAHAKAHAGDGGAVVEYGRVAHGCAPTGEVKSFAF
jgi:hypothetical protein